MKDFHDDSGHAQNPYHHSEILDEHSSIHPCREDLVDEELDEREKDEFNERDVAAELTPRYMEGAAIEDSKVWNKVQRKRWKELLVTRRVKRRPKLKIIVSKLRRNILLTSTEKQIATRYDRRHRTSTMLLLGHKRKLRYWDDGH